MQTATMSKKFVPTKATAGAVATEENYPDVRMRKTSGDKTSDIPRNKTVGGSSGPGYNFTGVTPGSKWYWLTYWYGEDDL